MHVCMHAYINVYEHINADKHEYVWGTYLCTDTLYTYISMHAYIHTYIHTLHTLHNKIPEITTHSKTLYFWTF